MQIYERQGRKWIGKERIARKGPLILSVLECIQKRRSCPTQIIFSRKEEMRMRRTGHEFIQLGKTAGFTFLESLMHLLKVSVPEAKLAHIPHPHPNAHRRTKCIAISLCE